MHVQSVAVKARRIFYRRRIRFFSDRREEGEDGQNDAEAGPDEADKSVLLPARPILADADDGDGQGEEATIEEGEDEALDDEEAEGEEEDEVFAAGFRNRQQPNRRNFGENELKTKNYSKMMFLVLNQVYY